MYYIIHCITVLTHRAHQPKTTFLELAFDRSRPNSIVTHQIEISVSMKGIYEWAADYLLGVIDTTIMEYVFLICKFWAF